MPLLSELSDPSEWLDPDQVPRPLVTIGTVGFDTKALDEKATALLLERKELGFHRHRKAELMLAMRGILTCEVDGGLWIVPPQSAIWVPGGVVHRFVSSGTLECYVAFIEPDVASALPASCCALTATPLLRELLIRSAALPPMQERGGMESHLVTLLLDEIAMAPLGNLHLPMPTDPRLRAMVEMMKTTPTDRSTMGMWARRVGMSERTMARALSAQTGMSFGRWRQQLHLMLAVQWLAAGASVQQVADDLGYGSASSFVSMFRKRLGAPPTRYMSQRAQWLIDKLENRLNAGSWRGSRPLRLAVPEPTAALLILRKPVLPSRQLTVAISVFARRGITEQELERIEPVQVAS